MAKKEGQTATQQTAGIMTASVRNENIAGTQKYVLGGSPWRLPVVGSYITDLLDRNIA